MYRKTKAFVYIYILSIYKYIWDEVTLKSLLKNRIKLKKMRVANSRVEIFVVETFFSCVKKFDSS